MQPTNVNLETLSVEKLKSLAYDLIKQSHKLQQDISLVEMIINKKSQDLVPKAASVEKTEDSEHKKVNIHNVDKEVAEKIIKEPVFNTSANGDQDSD